MFSDFLKKHVLILDGAMGTMIQDLHLGDDDFGGSEFKMLSDLLCFSRPNEVRDIHLNYLEAGANAIETNTFGASALRLAEYDFTRLDLAAFAKIPGNLDIKSLSHDDFAYHLNVRAAQIAQEAVQAHKKSSSYDGRALFVFGSVGPSNWVLTSTKANLRRGTYTQIVNNFYRQVLGLIDGGADVIIFETQQDPLELKAAIHGGQKAMHERGKKLPIIAQVTVDPFSKMQIFNTDIIAVLATVQGLGIDAFGINCSIGPDLMAKTVERLSLYSDLPISIMPNAGLPVSENGKTVFKFHPEAFATILHKYVTEFGVNLVGGCCGTRPDHIRVLSERLKNVTPKVREIPKRVLLSGPQNACELDGTSSLVRIGERLNVRGSAKVREAVENGGKINFDVLEEVCREQVSDLGLDIIDVCLDSNLVNTENTLGEVIRDITTDFPGAMCIDSFSVEALLAAIEVYPGRPILNSISMEEYAPGLDKIDAVVGKTHHHDPVYVGLATGPKGPGVTAEEKVDLARQIYEKCRDKYGVRANQLLIDVNAFPIGSESDPNINFAMESIRSIPLVKAIHPDLKVSMGVGNLTNGLAKKPYMRQVLTSVFVAEARKQGLDAAIINPHHYVPVESLDPAHVAIAKRVIINHDMDAFSELEAIAEAKKGGKVEKKSSYDSMSVEDAICQKVKDGYKQRIQGEVHDGDFTYTYEDAIVVQVAQVLHQHNPLDFINKYLMVAMKELGDGFGRGEVSLPHLLKSADVMKQAMRYIETIMRHKAGVNVHDQIQYKGVVVIGTVYQDVHSIGKDLVKTLLENYGYRVIDLGVQTPLEKFIHEAKVNNANAIGMSALLVQTSNHMITVAKMMQEAGMAHVDILIGGAPVNHRHAAYVSMHGQNDTTKQLDNVFYCPSGMDGVNVMNQLLESVEKRDHMLGENHEKLRWHYDQAVKQNAKTEELLKTLPRRVIVMKQTTWDPKVFCRSQKIVLNLSDFANNLDLKTLFSLNWRYGGKNSWVKKGTSEEKLKEQLATWIKDCDKNGWLVPQSVYGIFPCFRDGDVVVLLDPEKPNQEVARIPFTVVIGADKKDLFSAAQFFDEKLRENLDAIGLQISTGGSTVDQQVIKFKDDGDSASALLLQGLSDRVAEDMAEFTHRHLRQKLGIAPGVGTRYSPGYPGLQDIHVNQILADLLEAPQKIGITLTEAGEFYPTGTTGAVVCFHPDSRYD